MTCSIFRPIKPIPLAPVQVQPMKAYSPWFQGNALRRIGCARMVAFCAKILVVIALGLVLMPTSTHAQKTKTDTLTAKQVDSIRTEKYARRFNPRKALFYAAILPGLGQIYTKKYWKLPLVYGGLYATGYAMNLYDRLYRDYKSQLFYILETGNAQSLQGYTQDQLRPAINKVRRERDLMVIVMGAVYILQIVDAHVDAHLKEFNVNPDLQVKVSPFMENGILTGAQKGISLTLRF